MTFANNIYPPDRLLAGLLAAWATSVLAAFLVGLIWTAYSVRTPQGLPDLFSADALSAITQIAAVVATMSAIASAIATASLGYPVFRYLMRRGKLSATSSVAAGIVISLLVAAILVAAHTLNDFLVDEDFNMGVAAILASGPLSGFATWLVVARQPSTR